jgi:hypothetical protein
MACPEDAGVQAPVSVSLITVLHAVLIVVVVVVIILRT